MKHPHFFYHLYCINRVCPGSVFGSIQEIRLELTPENLIDIHVCPQCYARLVTAIDIEIRQILAEARIQLHP
jgi:hypothetical protein